MSEADMRLLRVLAASPEQLRAIDRILGGRGERSWARVQVRTDVPKIVSGGHVGAERTALDWAIENGVPHGGWCARGRKTLDGSKVPAIYAVTAVRGRSFFHEYIADNVRDSDGTVIFTHGPKIRHRLDDGGLMTAWRFAGAYNRPCLHLADAVAGERAGRLLAYFTAEHRVKCLNVVGERACRWPGISRFVMVALEALKGVPLAVGMRGDEEAWGDG